MASLTSAINVNVPTDVKEETTEIFNSLGLNMSTAINMFLKRVIYERGIPFDVKQPVPNKELMDALKEIEDIESGKISAKRYRNVQELFEELEKDV